jgi:transcriptional regulator with XRE-family HTH domain
MTLADWLYDNDSTQAALADALGVSKAYVSMLAAGTRVPSLAVACRIQMATDEAVKPADFLDA